MKILALDLGTVRTGWAHSDGGSGTQHFKSRRGDSPGMRWIEFKFWLNRVLDAVSTDVIAYEQAHHRGGAATHAGHGLIACVEEVAAKRELELTPRHSASIKSHALPPDGKKRKRNKEAMVRAAAKKWPNVEIETDDHADALWLLDLVQSELG